MKRLAIIPARGGSKRIFRKNIRPFLGKPIIHYSIECALSSKLFSEVMVSTDDFAIAKIAQQAGASVPFFRSKKNSSDYATTAEVLLEVLKSYESKGEKFDRFCCIYATAPFITDDSLAHASRILESDTVDSVLPIVQYSFPPQRALEIEKGLARFISPEYKDCRSQDLKPIYHDSGQFYFCRTDAFMKYRNMIMPQTVPIIISEDECQDIDNESDWRIAEIKYSLKHAYRKL